MVAEIFAKLEQLGIARDFVSGVPALERLEDLGDRAITASTHFIGYAKAIGPRWSSSAIGRDRPRRGRHRIGSGAAVWL